MQTLIATERSARPTSDAILAIAELLAADFNRDGRLTVADFGAFQTAFVLGDPRADFNGDGALTVADFGAFQTAFVAGCS